MSESTQKTFAPRWFLLVSLLLLVLSGTSHAKELQGRLGLGYNSEFANSTASQRVPGVSFKYGMTRDIAVEGIVGIAMTSPSNSVTALKVFKNIFYETNLNFYFMFGGGILSGGGNTGAEFLAGFGAEFFIPGIESLGFSMETGATFDNLSGSFTLKTLGVSFLDAGIHFYF
jgi:hypothetical protein